MGIHTLTSTDWRIKIDSDNGLQWLSGDVFRKKQWVAVMPDCTQAGTNLAFCNYLLLPYSNRIRHAKFEFEGDSVQLENADQHAIHGTFRNQVWQIQEASATRLLASCDSRECDSFNWPWPMQAECDISLDGPRLLCSLKVQNLSDSSTPIGGGWHPYFVRNIGAHNPRLSVPVTGVYPDTDGDCLPTGGPQPIPANLQFRDGAELPTDQRIDHCFAGLAGPMTIHWPDADIKLTLQSSEHFDHAVLFNPDEPYFALEPVTHANDALNLVKLGVDAGMETLLPGQTWQATLEMSLG